MKERLIEFLRAENKSSAQFAEEIGVQASGISHIISGRNNPSLDFVLKMLERYKFLSSDWLLFGKGHMYKEPQMQDLFSSQITEPVNNAFKPGNVTDNIANITGNNVTQDASQDVSNEVHKRRSGVIKIVWFYGDNSFEEFFPA